MNIKRSLLVGVLLCGMMQAADQKQDHAWVKAAAIGAAHGATFSLLLYAARPSIGNLLYAAEPSAGNVLIAYMSVVSAIGLMVNCDTIADKFLGQKYKDIANTTAFATFAVLAAVYVKATHAQQ
jgi:hypothetical protein